MAGMCDTRPLWVNSLAPGKCKRNFRHVIFKQILVIDDWGISCEIALIWMSLDFTDDQSTLNIGSGNGLVPTGNKPLPEPMLTQIYVATRPIWVKGTQTWPGSIFCLQLRDDLARTHEELHEERYRQAIREGSQITRPLSALESRGECSLFFFLEVLIVLINPSDAKTRILWYN